MTCTLHQGPEPVREGLVKVDVRQLRRFILNAPVHLAHVLLLLGTMEHPNVLDKLFIEGVGNDDHSGAGTIADGHDAAVNDDRVHHVTTWWLAAWSALYVEGVETALLCYRELNAHFFILSLGIEEPHLDTIV